MAKIVSVYLFLFLYVLLPSVGYSQFDDTHTNWKVSSERISPDVFDVVFDVTIDKNWHLYSPYLKQNDGPFPTTISFTTNDQYELVGRITESAPKVYFDDIFKFDVAYHEEHVVFKQRVKILSSGEVDVEGEYEFQVCLEDGMCIPGRPTKFSVKVQKDDESVLERISAEETKKILPDIPDLEQKESSETVVDTVEEDNDSVASNLVDLNEKHELYLQLDDENSIKGKPWWLIFLIGFGLGFAALLTPCVFPLIPMNVSFFLKRNESKGKGKMDATVFVLSIISMFVLLGMFITISFGESAIYLVSTSGTFNGIIFVLLMIFGASFLGAFEITLPSGLINKIDKQSDRGGILGIFFMALTLVVVSFSCTGPLVGTALAAAASSGNVSGSLWILLGFSSGLALPFGFFAFFPSLLNTIPQSGGWLNAVKVVLGLLEIALALKFLSNVDLVYQAGLLTRELFLVLWIAIFAITTVYFLGGFKTAHDADVPYLTVTRLFLAVISLSFTLYILPGLWGAPLKLLSGVLPPYSYSESPQGFGANASNHLLTMTSAEEGGMETNKNGITHFSNDYESALDYARKTNKPLMVDFTGRTCANCRKTEDYIWTDPEVKKRLNNDFVLVSLYVDERTKLPQEEIDTVDWNGEDFVIETIGNKFLFLEHSKYGLIAQPLYVLLDNNEKLVAPLRGYNSSIPDYIDWLDEGKEEFEKRKR